MSTEQGALLQEVRFKDLFDREILPSGHSFKLMPDTVDTALKVAEADDSFVWRKKAMQAFAVTQSVGSMNIHGEESPGVEFFHNMLDIDVIFLSLAWTAQMNGMSLDLAEGVPCPTCAHLFVKIPFGDLVIWSRVAPVGGPQATLKVEDLNQDKMPKSVQGVDVYVSDPTWMAARQNVAENSWSNSDVVTLYRAMTALRASPKSGSGPPRALGLKHEAKQIPMKEMNKIISTMDSFVPHFQQHLELICDECKGVSVVPFDQGL